MAYTLTPEILVNDVQTALLCAAGYLRGGAAVPTVAETMEAGGVLLKYGGQMLRKDGVMEAPPCPADKQEQAKILEDVAAGLAFPGVKAFPWALVIQIIMQLLQSILPFIPTPSA